MGLQQYTPHTGHVNWVRPHHQFSGLYQGYGICAKCAAANTWLKKSSYAGVITVVFAPHVVNCSCV